MSKQAICGRCKRRNECDKNLPKILPENRRALGDYHMMKMTSTLRDGGGYGDQSARSMRLLGEIQAHISLRQQRSKD